MDVAEKVLQLKQDFDDVYEAGKQAGGGDVNAEEIFKAGKKEVWRGITNDGARTDYSYGFQYTNLEYFEPQFDISPKTASYMFANSIGEVDLADKFAKNGVSLDFSNCGGFTRTFYNSKITRLGVIDCTKAKALDFTFGIMSDLHTIEKLIVDTDNTFSNTFNSSSALENIIVEGVIANDISFSSCKKLTHDSLMSIINHLETKTSGTFTLTIGATNIEKLTDDEINIILSKGWEYK